MMQHRFGGVRGYHAPSVQNLISWSRPVRPPAIENLEDRAAHSPAVIVIACKSKSTHCCRHPEVVENMPTMQPNRSQYPKIFSKKLFVDIV
jgi:hypothetical protein